MDFETAYDLVTNDYRRAIVAVLDETSPLSREQLMARLAAREVGVEDDAESNHPDRKTRRRLRVALHHNHLPRLDEMGVVEYDEETVAATPELDALVDRLERPRRDPAQAPDRLRDQLTAFYA